MRKYFLILILCVLNCKYTYAQSFSYHYLTVDNGLPERNVNSTVYDKFGTLWIGTTKGCYAYTGKKFIPINKLLDRNIQGLGTEFILIPNQFGFFDIKTTSGIFRLTPSLEVNGRFSMLRVSEPLIFNSTGWRLHKSVLYQWNNDTLVYYNAKIGDYKFLPRRTGDIYLSLRGDIVVHDTLKNEIYIKNEFKDSLFSINKKDKVIFNFFENLNNIKSIFVNKKLFTLYPNSLASIYNIIDSCLLKIEASSQNSGPKYTDVISINYSKHNNIIISTLKGLIIVQYPGYRIAMNNVNVSTRCILTDSLETRIANVFYSGFQTTCYGINNDSINFGRNWFIQGCRVNNQALFIEDGGLNRLLVYNFNTKTYNFIRVSANEALKAICVLNNQEFVIATHKRLLLCTLFAEELVVKKEIALPALEITKLVTIMDGKYLLIGTNTGLIRYNFNLNVFTKLLDEPILTSCKYGEGALVLAKNNAIYQVSGKRAPKLLPISFKDLSLVVYEMIWHQTTNTVWIGTDNGLYLLSKNLSHLVLKLNQEDGFNSNEFNTHSFYAAKKFVYTGGLNGINWFNPFEFVNKDPILPIYLVKLANDGTEDIYHIKLLNKQYTLEPNENSLKVYLQYYGPGLPIVSIGDNTSNYFAYSNNQLEINLYNLIPNLYNFKLTSFYTNGSSFLGFPSILVLKPWYIRWSYLTIWFTLLVIFVSFIIYFRLKVMENKYFKTVEENRQSLYQIIAHDLSSPINNLQRITQTLNFIIREKREKDLQLILTELDKSARAANLLLFNLLQLPKKKVNSQVILPYNVKENYIRICHAYQLISDTKILDFKFLYVGAEIVTINSHDWEILLRNTVDNCIKHAASYVKITLQVNANKSRLLMTVENDFESEKYVKLVKIKAAIEQNKVFNTGELGMGLGNILISKAMRELNAKAKMDLFSAYYKTTVHIRL